MGARRMKGWIQVVRCVVAGLCATGLTGCGQGDPTAAATGNGAEATPARSFASLDEMGPDDVVVSVNGVALTRGAFDDLLDVKIELYKAGRDPQLVRLMRGRFRANIVSEWTARQLALQEARAKNHTPSASAVERMRDYICQCLKLPTAGDALEQHLLKLGRIGRGIEKHMAENAVMLSFREALYPERLLVTEADIDRRLEQIRNYNARSEATNQLVMATGRRICDEIRDGLDFQEAVERYSEVKDDPPGFWGDFLKGEIEDEQVRQAAFTLPVGAVSEPLDTAEGLVIIKVLKRTDTVPVLAVDPGTVSLGRILLRMADAGSDTPLPTRAEVARALETSKALEVQREWLPRLAAQAVIAYPHGTNLLPRISRRSAPSLRPQPSVSE